MTTEQRIRMLQTPGERFDMVLDTDAYNEIDDQYAISYALLSPEKASLKALYAAPFYNGRSENPADGMLKSYDEIQHLLKLADKNVPVYYGSKQYLESELKFVESEAARDLSIRAMSYSSDQPLYVVAIGAITNIASAILMNPDITDRVVIVWLGGHSLDWPNNHEFNCMQDVAAARVVFTSGTPIVMLPCMGVVSAFTTTGPELEYWLKGKNPLCDYLVQHTIDAANEYAEGMVWSRPIWDVTAVGWLMNKDGKLMNDRLIPVPIPQYDHHYSVDPTAPLCKYVYYINRDELLRDLFSTLTK